MVQIRRQTVVLLGFAAFFAALLCVLKVDQPFAIWLKANDVGRFYTPVRTLTDAGESDAYFFVAIFGSLGAWLTLKYAKSLSETARARLDRIRKWCLFLLASLLVSGLFLHVFKFLFGRQRPHMTEDFQAHVFHPFNLHWHYQSMPSGHSQTLFTVATLLWISFPKYRWFFFVLAVAIALTRVLLAAHFLSDVIIGAYIGFLATLLVARRLHRVILTKS